MTIPRLLSRPTSPSIKFGDSFLMASVDEAKNMCEEKNAELEAEEKKLVSQQATFNSESDELKKKLYAKFGNQIMLDEN